MGKGRILVKKSLIKYGFRINSLRKLKKENDKEIIKCLTLKML